MPILKILSKYYLGMIALFFISRAFLFIVYFDKFKDSGVNYWMSFLHGLRMDTIIASALLLIPLILLSFSPPSLKHIINRILRYYFLIVFPILIYIENATFPFMAEYDVRPNYLFIEYLQYPKEVFATLFSDYKINFVIAFSIISGFIYIYSKRSQYHFTTALNMPYLKKVAWFLPLAFVLAVGIRSSFDHRPANNSDAMYSTNRTINEVTKNSFYNIAYALYSNLKYKGGSSIKQYGRMDADEALSRVQNSLHIQSYNTESPLSRLEKTHFKTNQPKNLVIFLQESIGYQHLESIGGKAGIMPQLTQLSSEGILFTDLYSNGTRSIRGVAAATAGNLAVPGKGVLKRNKAQQDFFTLSSLLEPEGYETLFLYGGESRFDNMRGWFIGNGFDRIIDQPQFIDPLFVGTWGVSDEDLVARANAEFKALHDKNQKFAAVMFSTSNHAPFDFPKDKIALLDGFPERSEENAVKYADYAIGKFIAQAKKEAYYQDTIFIIMADHNIKVRGTDMVPIDMFQIPALILGGNITPQTYDYIASQPDVLATALDLIGLDLNYPIMGASIFNDDKQNISLMQFHNAYALRRDDKVAIIQPNKEPQTYEYRERHLITTETDKALEKDALAFVVLLDHLYNNKLYK